MFDLVILAIVVVLAVRTWKIGLDARKLRVETQRLKHEVPVGAARLACAVLTQTLFVPDERAGILTPIGVVDLVDVANLIVYLANNLNTLSTEHAEELRATFPHQ